MAPIMTSTLMIPVVLLLTSIIPTFANSSPLNASVDEIWKNAVRRGSLLYNQMQSGCFPDKQTPITLSELRAQSWEGADTTGLEPQWPPHPELLRISGSVAKIMTDWTKGDDYYRVRLWHKIVPETTSLPETTYDNQYSPQNGLINALIMQRRANEPLHWSDVTFAVWEALSALHRSNIQDLRYIVLTEVDNLISTIIIDHAVVDPFEVAIFEPGTEAHRALLGSPNGVGSVYLLMEHKKQLGRKTIGRIIVCCVTLEEEEVGGPSMVFEILDLPAPGGLDAKGLIGNETGELHHSSHEDGCASFHGLVANA